MKRKLHNPTDFSFGEEPPNLITRWISHYFLSNIKIQFELHKLYQKVSEVEWHSLAMYNARNEGDRTIWCQARACNRSRGDWREGVDSGDIRQSGSKLYSNKPSMRRAGRVATRPSSFTCKHSQVNQISKLPRKQIDCIWEKLLIFFYS